MLELFVDHHTKESYSVDWGRPRPCKFNNEWEWNASWEADLEKFYGGIRESLPPSEPNLLRDFYIGGAQSIAMYIHSMSKNTLQLQAEIREFGMKALATENLAEDWAALDPPTRRVNILHAFYKSSGVGEKLRQYCPDLTIDSLSKDNGELFIDLLETIIGNDPHSVSSKIIHVPNKEVDYSLVFLQLKDVPNCYEVAQCNRTHFLSLLVCRILLAMYNVDQKYTVLRVPKQKDEIGPLQRARQIGCERLVRMVKSDIRIRKTNEGVDFCTACGENTSELPPGTKLKACSRCKKIGRTLWYCSKKCQADDWTAGVPKPHKVICGKPFGVNQGSICEKASSPILPLGPGNAARLDIPAPDPNFKRSPALLFQIQTLKENPNADYIIFLPQRGREPVDQMALQLGGVINSFRKNFLIFREKAFQRGDPEAVNEIFAILRRCSNVRLTEANIAQQLEREYRTTVNTNLHPSYSFMRYCKDEPTLFNDL